MYTFAKQTDPGIVEPSTALIDHRTVCRAYKEILEFQMFAFFKFMATVV